MMIIGSQLQASFPAITEDVSNDNIITFCHMETNNC